MNMFRDVALADDSKKLIRRCTISNNSFKFLNDYKSFATYCRNSTGCMRDTHIVLLAYRRNTSGASKNNVDPRKLFIRFDIMYLI